MLNNYVIPSTGNNQE